mmetsp:Transcript_22865/g.52362  ORF Transcript_22865/g.52362 Transcript_22865/m.52362 type:complete len:735 (+) Transcript_22865:41-2245(+)
MADEPSGEVAAAVEEVPAAAAPASAAEPPDDAAATADSQQPGPDGVDADAPVEAAAQEAAPEADQQPPVEAEDATVAQPSPEKAEGSSADAVEEQPTAGEADVKEPDAAAAEPAVAADASAPEVTTEGAAVEQPAPEEAEAPSAEAAPAQETAAGEAKEAADASAEAAPTEEAAAPTEEAAALPEEAVAPPEEAAADAEEAAAAEEPAPVDGSEAEVAAAEGADAQAAQQAGASPAEPQPSAEKAEAPAAETGPAIAATEAQEPTTSSAEPATAADASSPQDAPQDAAPPATEAAQPSLEEAAAATEGTSSDKAPQPLSQDSPAGDSKVLAHSASPAPTADSEAGRRLESKDALQVSSEERKPAGVPEAKLQVPAPESGAAGADRTQPLERERRAAQQAPPQHASSRQHEKPPQTKPPAAESRRGHKSDVAHRPRVLPPEPGLVIYLIAPAASAYGKMALSADEYKALSAACLRSNATIVMDAANLNSVVEPEYEDVRNSRSLAPLTAFAVSRFAVPGEQDSSDMVAVGRLFDSLDSRSTGTLSAEDMISGLRNLGYPGDANAVAAAASPSSPKVSRSDFLAAVKKATLQPELALICQQTGINDFASLWSGVRPHFVDESPGSSEVLKAKTDEACRIANAVKGGFGVIVVLAARGRVLLQPAEYEYHLRAELRAATEHLPSWPILWSPGPPELGLFPSSDAAKRVWAVPRTAGPDALFSWLRYLVTVRPEQPSQ